MNHGVYTPTFGEFDERALIDLAVRAEASGWDGFFPLNRDNGEVPLPPERLAECVEFVRARRGGEPFDVVVALHGQDTAPYAEGGATWCLYGVDPWVDSLADARARVGAGPPR